MLDGLLDHRDFPCGNSPATHQQMRRAESRPRCRGTHLIPISDCDSPPALATACEDCGEIVSVYLRNFGVDGSLPVLKATFTTITDYALFKLRWC